MATGGPLGWGGVDLCVCRSWLTGLPKPLPLPWICFSPPLPAASFLTGVVRSGRGVEVGCQLGGGRGGGGAGGSWDESLASWEGPGSRAQGAEGKADAAALPPTTTVSGAHFRGEDGLGASAAGSASLLEARASGLVGSFRRWDH